MKYVKAARISALTPGNKMLLTLEGRTILLVNIQNAYYAIDNRCPHMGGSLYDGKLEGSQIICPRHGSVFDVTTGKAVAGGKLLFMKIKVRDAQSYPVKTEGEDILIGIE